MIPPGNRDHINFKTHLILQSCDFPPVEFALSKKAGRASALISDILETEGAHSKIVLPLPEVRARVLEHIVVYMEYHIEYPASSISKPLKGPIKDYISEWDYQFLIERFGDKISKEINTKLLSDLVLAANLLNCKSLMELSCATVASIMQTQTLEEIRKSFQIENDFTASEYEGVLEESHWTPF